MVRVKVHANRTDNGDVIEQGRGPHTLPDEPIFNLDDKFFFIHVNLK